MQGINPEDLHREGADVGVTQVGTSSKATISHPDGTEDVVDVTTLDVEHLSVLLGARGTARSTGAVAAQYVEGHNGRVYLGRWFRR